MQALELIFFKDGEDGSTMSSQTDSLDHDVLNNHAVLRNADVRSHGKSSSCSAFWEAQRKVMKKPVLTSQRLKVR